MRVNKKAVRLLLFYFLFEFIEVIFIVFYIPYKHILEVVSYFFIAILFVFLLKMGTLKERDRKVISFFILTMGIGFMLLWMYLPYVKYIFLIPGALGLAISYVMGFVNSGDYRGISVMKLILVEVYCSLVLLFWLSQIRFPFMGDIINTIAFLLLIVFFYGALFNEPSVQERKEGGGF